MMMNKLRRYAKISILFYLIRKTTLRNYHEMMKHLIICCIRHTFKLFILIMTTMNITTSAHGATLTKRSLTSCFFHFLQTGNEIINFHNWVYYFNFNKESQYQLFKSIFCGIHSIYCNVTEIKPNSVTVLFARPMRVVDGTVKNGQKAGITFLCKNLCNLYEPFLFKRTPHVS